MPVSDKEIKDILDKYREKLGDKIKVDKKKIEGYNPYPDFSKEYRIFREEALSGKITTYERFCRFFESKIKLKIKQKDVDLISKNIESSHLDITPRGVVAFASVVGFSIFLLFLLYGIFRIALTGDIYSIMFPLLLSMVGILIIKPLTKIPNYIAFRWRLKASNQMVLCVLYIVMYMRHTSNLEHAIKFAAEHIQDPLSLDLRKIFWDVETKKYDTIKESIDKYLESWRDYNIEFVNSFHLIESSLYEPTEARRIELLEKSLDLMLTGTYEKMLHFAQNLKNPITMLHMLGVVLPILGLVIFPLLGSFLNGAVKWYHLFILYNIFLPVIVYLIGINVLSKRPTGYGETEIGYKNDSKPIFIPLVIFAVFFLISITPFLINLFSPGFDFNFLGVGKFFDYKQNSDGIFFGPFGVGALVISLFLPIGLAFSVSHYYKKKVGNLMKKREETKKLELEFSSSLFQLGTRIGDGVPAEVAFEDVAVNMERTPTGVFFKSVSHNIRNLGMNLEEAIFNLNNGAIINYPSSLVEGSMEVLVEGSRKGPGVVSKSLISISNYASQIHSVNERLKDLLSDVVSSMKSQINFLAPVIAGIVVGVGSLIVTIITKLNDLATAAGSLSEDGTSSIAGISSISSFFNIYDVIPSYFFQIIIGLYVVEIIYVLSVLSNSIENGPDKLNEQNDIAKNLHKSVIIYSLVALLVILIFNGLASVVLSGLGGTT